MNKDFLPEQQLIVEQILNQIPTFLVGDARLTFYVYSDGLLVLTTTLPPYPSAYRGHETTSVSTTWTLFALACHPEIQSKPREELRAFPYDSPSMAVSIHSSTSTPSSAKSSGCTSPSTVPSAWPPRPTSLRSRSLSWGSVVPPPQ